MIKKAHFLHFHLILTKFYVAGQKCLYTIHGVKGGIKQR